MFTSLSTYLGVKPRHAEQNDTRQDIQRHDPDHERRKNKKKDDEEELFNEGGADVSISALTAFLNKFLKELSDKQPKQGFNETSSAPQIQGGETPAPEEAPKPTSPHAAKAAGAYQHMAESQQSNSILGDINESNADLISLDAAEVRIIHALLADLKLLSDKNIEHIHIARAESFLQSLTDAVETVKKSSLFKT